MVRMALRGTSWSHLLDYASPALFEVIPARALLAQSRELFANRANTQHFSELRESVGTLLRERDIAVELIDGPSPSNETKLTDLPESSRHDAGQRVLDIFFIQVFGCDEALLDLRADKFTRGRRGTLSWRPGALYVRWQPEFLEGLRGLYVGFYLDDPARFDAALRQLGMEGSGDALRNLLGRDDPRSARFESEAFHANFHELFVRYRDSGTALHRNFVPLGVSLMCLYDTLDALGVTLDVRASVERGHAAP